MDSRRAGTDDTRYIGSSDPDEADRLARQDDSGASELAAALGELGNIRQRTVTVLEIGCGAGHFTHLLLEHLPHASIVGIDRDQRLLDAANGHLRDAVLSGRLELLPADTTHFGLDEHPFDLVACRCVLMHQPDPFIMVGEMFRLLKPGGHVLAIEPDWGARALYPDGEALSELVAIAARAQRFGFPDLQMGRKLFALLRAGGFRDVRVIPHPFVEAGGDDQTLQPAAHAATGPGQLLEQARRLLRSNGVLTDDQVDGLQERFMASRRNPEHFSAGVDFTAIGTRPAIPEVR